MKLKALDTLLVSSVKSDNILGGEVFEVSDNEGRGLIERGYAVEVKASPKPDNKMKKAAANKSAPKAKGK